jgi:putative FmdB family regulatory protein
MPTYEYACEDCGHHFDEFQSITAPVLTDCPACKKKALKRLIGTGAGLIFKGSGFYVTDYKNNAGKLDASVDRHKKAAKEVKESSGGSSSAPAGGFDTSKSKQGGSSSSGSNGSS